MTAPAARLSIVTLGVADVGTATRFYEALGWHRSAASQPSITFFHSPTAILALFNRAALAEDAHVPDESSGFSGVTLAWNCNSEADVDLAFDKALTAGATRVKAPQKVFWGGYSGYFADPDGHLWEVAHNPFVTFDDHGRLILPGDAA